MAVQALTLPQCKEYLKNIYELEIACYQQERLCKQLRERVQRVQKNATEQKIPSLYKKKSVLALLPNSLIVGVLTGGIGGAVIGALWRIIVTFFIQRDYSSSFLPYLIRGALIGSVLMTVISVFMELSDESATERASIKQQEKIKQQQEKALHYQKELPAVQRDLQDGLDRLDQTRNILKQFYDLNFIYPKYRKLVIIATLYEYLQSGRCFSLVGPGGAYNLYESELRQNIIIGKLDDIMDKLDRLNEGQQMLAAAIQQSNARIDQLSRSLERIENNTALSAYYNGITAANTDYLAWLATFS